MSWRKFVVLTLAALSLSGAAFAQGTRRDGIVLNSQGRPVGGATIRVCTGAAQTPEPVPCSPLASVYSDVALTVAKTNPFTADANGNYFYYAAIQAKEQITGPGITTSTTPDVSVGVFDTLVLGKLNNILFVDGVKYAKTAAGINLAIADAIALGGGVVDASAITGNMTWDAQVDVGNTSSIPVTLILAHSLNTNITINDSTKYAIKIYNNSSVVTRGNGPNQGNLALNVTASVRAIVGTDDSAGSATGTFRLEGLAVYNVNGGTVAEAAVLFRGFKDLSVIRNVQIVNPLGVGLKLGGTTANAGGCCLKLDNVWLNGSNGGTSNTTAQPLLIVSSATGGSVNSINYIGGSIVQPGLGQNAVKIDGGGNFLSADINFYGVHGEGSINPSETTTPFVLMTNSAGNVRWFGGAILYSFGTNYSFRVEGSSNDLLIAGARTGHNNLVNNAVTGLDFVGVNANIAFYSDHAQSQLAGATIDAVAVKRIKASRGTALVAGDFGTPSAGCGSTASISAVTANSRDQTFEFGLTSAGTGQGANTCTVTLTFKDGTFTNAPFLTCGRNDLVATAGTIAHTTKSATAPVLTFKGTPVAGDVYAIACNFLGN